MENTLKYWYGQVDLADITSRGLQEAAASLQERGVRYQCYAFGVEGHEVIEAIFIPSWLRVGIAWGDEAKWTNAQTMIEALDLYFFGDEETVWD